MDFLWNAWSLKIFFFDKEEYNLKSYEVYQIIIIFSYITLLIKGIITLCNYAHKTAVYFRAFAFYTCTGNHYFFQSKLFSLPKCVRLRKVIISQIWKLFNVPIMEQSDTNNNVRGCFYWHRFWLPSPLSY